MNTIEPVADPKRGILLTDTVDIEWLKSVTPRFYERYIKFMVDFVTEQVYVGMDFHALNTTIHLRPKNSDSFYLDLS